MGRMHRVHARSGIDGSRADQSRRQLEIAGA
jgi:hypothetical protein